MINVAINGIKLFFQALFRTGTHLSRAKRMSVIHSFCPQGLHSSFLISGVHSLSVPSLSFSLRLQLSSSLVQQLWSTARVKRISHTHTYGPATVRLECSWGCGGAGLDFPMPIVNCWLYLKLRGDLHCPLHPCAGPWPLAQRLCLLPCWDTQWIVCVCCVCYWPISGGVLSFSHQPFSHQPQHYRLPAPRPGQVICLLKTTNCNLCLHP